MPVRVPDERLGVGDGAELRIDVAVVGDVVPAIRHRRGVPRSDPDGVHPEVAQVAEPGADAGDIANAVSVAVGEAADVDLVDDRVSPPTLPVAIRAVAADSRIPHG